MSIGVSRAASSAVCSEHASCLVVQAGIEAAVARRPLLIERSGVAAAGREGRRSATLAMVERLAGEGVTPAVAGITLGDDDYDDV